MKDPYFQRKTDLKVLAETLKSDSAAAGLIYNPPEGVEELRQHVLSLTEEMLRVYAALDDVHKSIHNFAAQEGG
jgi:hypothetical protein